MYNCLIWMPTLIKHMSKSDSMWLDVTPKMDAVVSLNTITILNSIINIIGGLVGPFNEGESRHFDNVHEHSKL